MVLLKKGTFNYTKSEDDTKTNNEKLKSSHLLERNGVLPIYITLL